MSPDGHAVLPAELFGEMLDVHRPAIFRSRLTSTGLSGFCTTRASAVGKIGAPWVAGS